MPVDGGSRKVAQIETIGSAFIRIKYARDQSDRPRALSGSAHLSSSDVEVRRVFFGRSHLKSAQSLDVNNASGKFLCLYSRNRLWILKWTELEGGESPHRRQQ